MSVSKQRGVRLVVAMAAESRGIGREGGLPWRLPQELKVFREVTQTAPHGRINAVVMGRRTWASIPAAVRPLKGRLNVVLSRKAVSVQACAELRATEDISEDVLVACSLNEAMEQIEISEQPVDKVFIIGGASLYAEALARDDCEAILLTKVYGDFDCDVFFPDVDSTERFECVGTPDHAPKGMREENGVEYEFLEYRQKREKQLSSRTTALSPNPEEEQYLDMVRDVLENGDMREDRTGTGTLSTFGRTMRFSLRNDTMPLLTTKRVFWRGVAEELLWFISGDTNANTLSEKGINIWKGNGSREYLDKLGLTEREEGDLGPIYGFQWRHFGAEYNTMHDDYTGQGVDQLKHLIHTIKTNPTDRRMIISAWNPAAFHLMALPPCHMFAQFHVSKGELSCQMYQRSGDIGLGIPFNIASYALLTHLVARCTGLKAGEFIHVIGDCHIYKNHVDALREQLQRTPRPFPKIKIKEGITDIDSFNYDDLELIEYKPHKIIKMEMSV